MTTKTCLLLAAAVLAGSATIVMAQTAPYDETADHYLSYGPKAPTAAATGQHANPMSEPIAPDTVNPYDQTSDHYLSYGVRTQR